jgi:hypothetical protein
MHLNHVARWLSFLVSFETLSLVLVVESNQMMGAEQLTFTLLLLSHLLLAILESVL